MTVRIKGEKANMRDVGLVVLLLFAVGVGACREDVGKATTLIDYSGHDSYGDASEHATLESEVINVDDLSDNLATLVGKSVTVSGTITEVCQMTGCWLAFSAPVENVESESVMIRVSVPRDSDGAYVYTVPNDIAGRKAYVTGVVQKDDVAAAHGYGLASGQEAQSMTSGDTENIAAPTSEINITAVGVSVVPATQVTD